MATSKKAADDAINDAGDKAEDLANPTQGVAAASLIEAGEGDAPKGYAPEDRVPEPFAPDPGPAYPDVALPGGAAARNPNPASVADQAAAAVEAGNITPGQPDVAGTSPSTADAIPAADAKAKADAQK